MENRPPIAHIEIVPDLLPHLPAIPSAAPASPGLEPFLCLETIMVCSGPTRANSARWRLKEATTEAALLPFFFFQYIGQKIRQRALPRKLGGHLRLESVAGHLDAQRFALAEYLHSSSDQGTRRVGK